RCLRGAHPARKGEGKRDRVCASPSLRAALPGRKDRLLGDQDDRRGRAARGRTGLKVHRPPYSDSPAASSASARWRKNSALRTSSSRIVKTSKKWFTIGTPLSRPRPLWRTVVTT